MLTGNQKVAERRIKLVRQLKIRKITKISVWENILLEGQTALLEKRNWREMCGHFINLYIIPIVHVWQHFQSHCLMFIFQLYVFGLSLTCTIELKFSMPSCSPILKFLKKKKGGGLQYAATCPQCKSWLRFLKKQQRIYGKKVTLAS